LFQGAVKLGQEGIVAKDGKSPYVEGPRLTWHWQKIKNKEYKRQGVVR
jgi:ATP-dependent DNA ligase